VPSSKPTLGVNDLQSQFPDIAAEAYGWDPSTVVPGSHNKLDWKCDKGHIYPAEVRERTNGSRCPYCIGRKALAGFNDLQTKYPEIAEEAYGWDTTTVTSGSNQRKDWKCTEGHIYPSVVYDRTKGAGCPVCSGQKVLAGFNDLKTKFPDIAREAYGWDPATLSSGSGQKKDWKCTEGHIYPATVDSRTNMKSGCSVCSGMRVLAGFNDLKTKFPDIAAEAYGWDSSTVVPGTHQKKDWKCEKGHVYPASVSHRTGQGRGCPFCSSHQVLKGFNDLQTKYPEIAAEAYGWDPATVTSGSGQKKDWKCDKGHIYPANINSRTSSGRGCPYCGGLKVLAGFNDLQTRYPVTASEAYGWDPKTIMPGSVQKKDWICNKGHIYSASINSRTSLKSGCAYCAGVKVLAGFNDLKTKFPDIAKEAYGWDPTAVTAGTEQKKDWICDKGHIYPATVSSRTNVKSGCPICSNNQVLVGFNDLKSKFPDIAAEAYGWDPSTVVAGTDKKKDWKCNKGHLYHSAVSSRTSSGSGCPVCAVTGFNPEKDAWFYLMHRPGEQQLGITNDLPARMKKHERNGWTLLEHSIEGASGKKVQEIEALFKKWLKKEIGLMDGTTENWSTTKMEVQSLAELKARSGIETDLF